MNDIQHSCNSAGILTITLNRPEKLNALSVELLEELSLLIEKAKTDKAIKAILLTGNGKAFCAGADINRLAECDAQTGFQFALRGQEIFRNLETLGKPSLAAINGYAFGGGCELLLSTTIRIASTNAQFGQPEVKLGVIPGYGGTQRLARLVGKGRAMDLCLTGRFIDAQTALQWGLITHLSEPEALLVKAEQILNDILALSPLATKSVMEVIDLGYDMRLPDALHLEALHFGQLCAMPDKKEGVEAFLTKRKPVFSGDQYE